ncbi:zinc dependent phospholipase C family protein [Tepidibacillus decaturensis]|uniref:Phospholipase C/D domain-containing protein n=1 Tax=Tepidibacillus decaturensis TaxID=1413211 RepID=A0A135L3H1_9BACI|nr:zinc dependent phospholipase C family protein [Tepidibacillus decaturensis]KXG43588.1 hypothetical protein U473_05845 [Tepidibacillus decaturensis]
MPNVWTHNLFGEHLDKEIGYDFLEHKEIYYLGCQGPDPFFYHHFWPWRKDKSVTKIGSLLHKKHCGSFLVEMVQYLKQHPDPLLKAYVFGFVSHHLLDRNTHPYIVYRSGEEGNKHQKLEIMIDTLMMKRFKGVDTWKTPVFKEIDVGKNLPSQIQQMLIYLIKKVHAEKRPDLQLVINQSYQDMIKALKFLFDPTGIKHILLGEMVSPFSYSKKIPNKDFLNLQHTEWFHPTNGIEGSKESFLDLFDRAKQEAIPIYQCIEDYLRGIKPIEQMQSLIGNVSYETGKPCDAKLENQFFELIL